MTRPSYNIVFAEWTLKKNAFDTLRQDAAVTSPIQTAIANWKAKDNVTKITRLSGGVTSQSTVPGMFLLRLVASNGAMSIESTP